MATIFLQRDPRWSHLVPPQSAEASAWFLENGDGRPNIWVEASCRGWFRRLAGGAERLTVPGIILHYALRKRYLEEIARRSLAEGYTQVIILGAGYDTLALRLHQEFPEVLFIEADHPATQVPKRRALERRGLPMPNLRFVETDLAKASWERSLLAVPGYGPQARTLAIAEGVLVYLRSHEVDRIFGLLGDHAGPRARFAFTFMEPRESGKIAFRRSRRSIALWLRLRGEPFRWGIRREHLPRYLECQGYILCDLATPDTFRTRYLPGLPSAIPPLAEGECLGVAERL